MPFKFWDNIININNIITAMISPIRPTCSPFSLKKKGW